jgi:opacity protein-like surface antigen
MNHLYKIYFVLPALSVLILIAFSSYGLSQDQFNSEYSSESSRKPVVDYYDNIDDKSFYQQKRIYGMKGELNNYSEKLHNLQDRFDQIFYGLSSKGNFQTPFDTSNQPARPILEPRTDTVPAYPDVQSDFTSTVEIPVVPEPSENTLAFNVNSPGTFIKDDQVVSTFNPNDGQGLGYYFLISPGMSFANKTHDTARAYKKYDPGFSTTIAGGFKVNNFKIGLGGAYKSHSFSNDSKLKLPIKFLSGSSETFAGYLNLGYNFRITKSLDLYAGVGLGYYLSLIDDNGDLSTRKDHGVFLTGNTGISMRMSELFALSLGYRYFHENEVPAHIVELGANFDF